MKSLPVLWTIACISAASAAPAWAADCSKTQDSLTKLVKTEHDFQRETDRNTALSPAPKYDAGLCRAATAEKMAASDVLTYLNRACLKDAESYTSTQDSVKDVMANAASTEQTACEPK